MQHPRARAEIKAVPNNEIAIAQNVERNLMHKMEDLSDKILHTW